MKRIDLLLFLFCVYGLCTACGKEDDPVTVGVTGISIDLDVSELTMIVGDSRTLSCTVTPAKASNKAVYWQSLDEEVVGVDGNGKLIAISAGTTYVVLTSLDNSRLVDQIRIVVSDPLVRVTGVAIGSEDFGMETGSDIGLTYNVLPENATNRQVAWVSLEPDVAVVDEAGRVDALSEGIARIVLISLDDTRITDTVSVTVTDPVIDVTATNILDDDFQLLVGRTKTLACEVSPADATFPQVIWTSSDPQVASVDDRGVVTALTDGSAHITAVCEKYPQCTDGVTVTVRTGVSSIAVEIDNPVVYAGFQRQATCMVGPQNASQNVTWSSSDPGVATVDENGTVTALTAGTAVIVVTSTDGSAIQGSAEVTVLNSLTGTYVGTLAGKQRSISVKILGKEINIIKGVEVYKENYLMTVTQISETQCVVVANIGDHTCNVTCGIAYDGTNTTTFSGQGGVHRGKFGSWDLDCRTSVKTGSYITNQRTIHLDLMREASGEVATIRLGWHNAFDYLQFNGQR